MTSSTTHPLIALWRGGLHFLPPAGGHRPAPLEGPRFRVRDGTAAELALLAGWLLLAGLFLLAVA